MSLVKVFDQIIRPFLFRLDPENAHQLILKLLALNLVPKVWMPDTPRLRTSIWGQNFKHPIGLAAGFDKNAAAITGLYKLGFSFIEAGTVTPIAQTGISRPRIFRSDEDEAIINKLGFNNLGLDVFTKNMRIVKKSALEIPIGANIGKNKDTEDAVVDYVKCFNAVLKISDYIVVNVSSPNTEGLRELQTPYRMERLLAAVLEERELASKMIPILLKVAPELDQDNIMDISNVALKLKLDGIICTNTTLDRTSSLMGFGGTMEGGLSGRPLYDISTSILKSFFLATEGRIPLIGVGGVSTGNDAYKKIRAGASLIQIYSSMIFRGPLIVSDLVSELNLLVERDGFNSVQEAIGADLKF